MEFMSLRRFHDFHLRPLSAEKLKKFCLYSVCGFKYGTSKILLKKYLCKSSLLCYCFYLSYAAPKIWWFSFMPISSWEIHKLCLCSDFGSIYRICNTLLKMYLCKSSLLCDYFYGSYATQKIWPFSFASKSKSEIQKFCLCFDCGSSYRISRTLLKIYLYLCRFKFTFIFSNL